VTASPCTIVVPAWNEAARLDVEAFVAHATAHPEQRLLFVNDGSTDDTAAVLDTIRAGAPQAVDVLHLERNVGKGEAVRRGLSRALESGAAAVGFLDADLAAPLASIGALARELEARGAVQLVIGSRVKLLGWAIERSEWRHYPGRVFATCASLALGLPVYDTQCGAKLLRAGPVAREVVATPFQSRWLFDVELIARVRDAAGAAALREVPLEAWADRGGSSLRLRDFLRAPWELWRIRRRYPPRRAA
jgi:glycosyltransferase involved in cell wall biosynthesis